MFLWRPLSCTDAAAITNTKTTTYTNSTTNRFLQAGALSVDTNIKAMK